MTQRYTIKGDIILLEQVTSLDPYAAEHGSGAAVWQVVATKTSKVLPFMASTT